MTSEQLEAFTRRTLTDLRGLTPQRGTFVERVLRADGQLAPVLGELLATVGPGALRAPAGTVDPGQRQPLTAFASLYAGSSSTFVGGSPQRSSRSMVPVRFRSAAIKPERASRSRSSIGRFSSGVAQRFAPIA